MHRIYNWALFWSNRPRDTLLGFYWRRRRLHFANRTSYRTRKGCNLCLVHFFDSHRILHIFHNIRTWISLIATAVGKYRLRATHHQEIKYRGWIVSKDQFSLQIRSAKQESTRSQMVRDCLVVRRNGMTECDLHNELKSCQPTIYESRWGYRLGCTRLALLWVISTK